MAEADPTRPGGLESRLDAAAQQAGRSRPARSWGGQARRVVHEVPTWEKVIAALLLIVALAWAVLFITKGRFLKGPFETILSRNLQRDVRVDGDFNLYFAPLSLRFRADRLTISNPAWASRPNLFKADRIDTRLSTLSLLTANKTLKTLLLQKGAIDLEWSKDGKANTWTFGDPKAPPKPLDMPTIRQALIAGTTLRYRDPRVQLYTDIAIDTVKARDTRFAHAVTFHGDGSMRGRPFTLRGSLLSPNEAVEGGRTRLELHAQAASTRVDVAGTLPAPTVIEGAQLQTAARGPNLSLLFDVIGIAIPDTRSFRIGSQLTKHGGEWRFTRIKGMFGDSDIGGAMTISLPDDRLMLSADLSTQRLDIVDVGPFIGYSPAKVDRAEQAGVAALVENVGGTPRLLPDAPLRADALKLFDADVKYSVRTVTNQNVPISNIALALKLDHNLLILSPLTFDMSGGHVTSDISIDARKQPVFTKYDIRLSPTPMGKLLSRWGVEGSGTTGTLSARIAMTGTGDSVRKSLATSNGRIAVILPAGTMWARNIQLSELDVGTFIWKMWQKKLKDPVQINCGLIAFTVRDGVASADPILIDTKKNVMLGRGGFSFRDESLGLKFRADSKKFSLFSGQSPVAINGYFARPGFGIISPELIARGGAGLALGIAANPLAGLLAFVDVGDAKAAQCGPVLSAASAAAQRTKGGKPRKDVGDGVYKGRR